MIRDAVTCGTYQSIWQLHSLKKKSKEFGAQKYFFKWQVLPNFLREEHQLIGSKAQQPTGIIILLKTECMLNFLKYATFSLK